MLTLNRDLCVGRMASRIKKSIQFIMITSGVTAMAMMPGLIWPGVASAESQFSRNAVTIRHDAGGRMLAYALRAMDYRDARTSVAFKGRCDSACTLYLGLPSSQTCISRNASFGFHMPYGASASQNRTAANFMMQRYPSWVRSWIRSRGGLKGGIMRMDYAYASKYIKPCDGATRQTALAKETKSTKNISVVRSGTARKDNLVQTSKRSEGVMASRLKSWLQSYMPKAKNGLRSIAK